jgi:DNA polymerase III sliding clamp (beta) subunit (PCNA family)
LEAQLVRGSSMDIVVNGKYLLQAVKAAKAELVVLQVSAPYEPLLIYPFAAEGASPECKAVIMPMHLK